MLFQLLGLAVGASAQLSSLALRDGVNYVDPNTVGGSMLTVVNDTYPPGLGEPINVILSAKSDPEVLIDSLYDGGFQNYMLSANLSAECLGGGGPGLAGSKQEADLDGSGNATQINMLRWNFGDPWIGTCRETFEGGLHFRYWKQNTTGAMFLAASVEMELAKQHDIVPNGYNLGRDYVVGNLTKKDLGSRNVTNATVISGTTSFRNYTYETNVHYVSGLLANSSDDINHFITVEAEGHPAQDGLVAVLTVKITARPENSSIYLSIPLLTLLACVAASLLI